ncbi:hypothetical protein N0V83_004786 [Neocucurbitaria cava]|uniref:Carboxypeptidase n=1 Tax=Neocucurbitaria cava TaxID=798079 RepID=A0A9W9CNH9_9PLEO|nr:hypothetical protein N0V83_004786 [Neocucurbitaria cava]
MFQLLPIALAYAVLIICSLAQQFPPPVTYDAIIPSPVDPNITISYRQPSPGTCATTFDTQKQYTGYVNLPPFTLMPYQQNYSINTFFWFFESRTNPETAPLTVWLNGGPGSSSMVGLFQELGPCEVVLLPNGSYGTQSRLWGWDRSSNLLFIDQPTQTGFSYDERVNASVDFTLDAPFGLDSRLAWQDIDAGAPSWRFMNGTFASGRKANTQNLTAIAARACWHFLQGFLSVFHQYNPGVRPNSTSVEAAGVHLFAESYGGTYGPIFADFFEDQNDQRRNGSISADTLEIRLESVGIVNGLLDPLVQTIAVANYTRNNTFGIVGIDRVTFENIISYATSGTGCRGLIAQCRSEIAIGDRESAGPNDNIDRHCKQAIKACLVAAEIAFKDASQSIYGIRVKPEVWPGDAYQEYLNSADVQISIGAQVNFTQSSTTVYNAFEDTGDAVRGTQLSSLAELLARGVRVALIYGDADIICNWYGGQNASLELARLLPGYDASFPRAGYADIVVNNSYVGGQVRQYGNLSFSRIYDAGHMVPYYQPETAFTVFTRIIQGDDIGMGRNVDLSTFGTEGLENSLHQNKVPDEPASTCWLRDASSTCTEEERAAMRQGQGIVKAGIWVHGDESAPRSTSQGHPVIIATKPATTSSIPRTGVYTATGTPIPRPSVTSGASRRVNSNFDLLRRAFTAFDPAQAERDADSARKTRNGLIGGLSAAGALLLSLLCCRCCRRRRNKDGILPVDTEKAPAVIVAPVRDAEPVASRHPTIMDPIPEMSPRPSKDTVPTLRSATVASRAPTVVPSRRPSDTVQEPTTPVEVIPVVPVQRAVTAHQEPPTRAPTMVLVPLPVQSQDFAQAPQPEAAPPATRSESVSHPAPTRAPTVAPLPPRPNPIPTPPRTPTPPPQGPEAEPEPAPEPKESPAPAPEPNDQPESDVASPKPSLITRVKDAIFDTGDEKEDAAEEAAPERDPTPPPRVATQPPLFRAPTAPLPSRHAEEQG